MLAKSKLNSIELLISKALTDSVISHDESVLINNILKLRLLILRLNQVHRIFSSIYKTTLLYCLKSTNPKVARTRNKRIMLLSKYVVCDGKKSKFLKQQEASGLLSSLGIKKPLNKILLLGSRLV